MMAKFLTILLMGLFVQTAYSKEVFKDNPYSMFSAKDNMEKQTNVIWRPVSDIQKECEKESLKRKLGGFGYSVTACSIWEKGPRGPQCLIITAMKLNMHTLGHEMRHCFQGNYHP